jgi:hypothetical protein
MLALTDAAWAAGSDQPAASLPHPQDLNVESGLNDGVGVPLPFIFRTVAKAEEGIGHVKAVKWPPRPRPPSPARVAR